MALVVGADAGGISETRLAILQFTNKPKLSDKHMKRPPFAFIHAIVKNIILNTSYQRNLFMKSELDASNIKSKSDKIAWLQKIKDAVNKDLRISMTLNLGKVCAGKEVENTRMFLQHFCRATKMHVDLLGAEKVKLEAAATKFAMGMQDEDTGGVEASMPSKESKSNGAAKKKADADAAAAAAKKAEEEAAAKKAAEEAAAKAAADEAAAKKAAEEAEARKAADKAAQEAAALKAAEDAAAQKATEEAAAKKAAEDAAKKAAEEAAAQKTAESKKQAKESKSPEGSGRRRRRSSVKQQIQAELTRTPTQELKSLLSKSKQSGALDVGIEVAKSRAAISAIISKPELTDKLMSRPPFTFLHAIIRHVLSTTGYNATLFNSDELNAKTITSKVAKMAFLEKIAVVVSKDINKPVAVRYGKICAGKEVAKTHVFLQHICEAATAFQKAKREEEASIESASSNATGNSEAEEKAGRHRRRRSLRRSRSSSPDTKVESKTRKGPSVEKQSTAAIRLQTVWRRYHALVRFKQLVENMFLTKLEIQEAMDMARVTKSSKDLRDILAASRSTLPRGHKLSIAARELVRELEGIERILNRLRKAMSRSSDGDVSNLLDAIQDAEKVVEHDHDLLVQARLMQSSGLEVEAIGRLRGQIEEFKDGLISSASLERFIKSVEHDIDSHNRTLLEAKKLVASKSQDTLEDDFQELVDDAVASCEDGNISKMFSLMDEARAFAFKHLTPKTPCVRDMKARFADLLEKLACKQSNPRKYGVLTPERNYTIVRFKDGPIGAGFGFRPDAWACVIIRFNDRGDKYGQAEASGRLAVGDWLVKVDDHDVRGQSWNYVKQIIKNSSRPLSMVFCKPFDWSSANLNELPHDFVTEKELAVAQEALHLGDMGRTMGRYKPPETWDEVKNAPMVHRWLKGALKLSQTDRRMRKVCKCVLGSDGLFVSSTWHNPSDTLFGELQDRASRTLADSAASVDTTLYQKQHLVDVLGLHPENGRAFEIVINSQGLPTRKYEPLPRQDNQGLFPRLLWSEAEDDYTYMCCMLLSMVALNRGFQNYIKSKVDTFDGKHRPAPIKSPMKIWRTLSGNSGEVASPVAAAELDLMRCCVSFHDPQDLLACYESLVTSMGDAVNIDNQFAQGFNAVDESGGFRALVVNWVYSPPGLTWGQVLRSKQTSEIWDIWSRSMEAQLGQEMWDLLGEFVDHAKSVLLDCVGMASRPVSVVVEVKLTLTGYIEHLKRSTMWRNIANADSPSKLQGEYVRFARERQPTVRDILTAKRAATKLKSAFKRKQMPRRSFSEKAVLGGGESK